MITTLMIINIVLVIIVLGQAIVNGGIINRSRDVLEKLEREETRRLIKTLEERAIKKLNNIPPASYKPDIRLSCQGDEKPSINLPIASILTMLGDRFELTISYRSDICSHMVRVWDKKQKEDAHQTFKYLSSEPGGAPVIHDDTLIAVIKDCIHELYKFERGLNHE